MARSRKPQAPTKKHLARQEREARQRKIIVTATVAVVAIVVFLVVYGYVQANVLEPRQPVAEVNGTTIVTEDFVERTRFERNSLVQQAISNYQTLQLLGEEQSDLTLSFLNNIQQIRFQLDPTSFGREVLNRMIDDVLIAEEAQARGIEITDEDVQQELQLQFGFSPEGLPPTPTAFPTTRPTSTLSPAQLALITPIPTFTPFPTATPDQAATATQVPSPTGTLAPTLTATPYTEEAFQQNFNETIQQFEDQIGVSEATIRAVIQAQLYRQKLADQFAIDLPLTEDQVWARHILLEDEETAQQVYTQLQEGGDFGQLAAEFSVDTSNSSFGGDLGWFTTGMMVPEFEIAAYNLDVGEISEPVQTQFGWHIIQVLGREERSLNQQQYQQAVQTLFDEWLQARRTDADIEIFDSWTEVAPEEPSIPQEILQQLGS
jgi:hypothetical protein